MKVITYLFTLACCTLSFTGCNTLEPDIFKNEGTSYEDRGPVIPGEIERGGLEQAELFDVPETYGPGLYDFPQLFPEPYITPNPNVPPEEGIKLRF